MEQAEKDINDVKEKGAKVEKVTKVERVDKSERKKIILMHEKESMSNMLVTKQESVAAKKSVVIKKQLYPQANNNKLIRSHHNYSHV